MGELQNRVGFLKYGSMLLGMLLLLVLFVAVGWMAIQTATNVAGLPAGLIVGAAFIFVASWLGRRISA